MRAVHGTQIYNMNVILITRKYPYGDITEVFLESELQIASQYCSVTILPLTKTKKCRELPNNISVNNACCEHTLFLYMTVFFEMIFSNLFWKSIFSNDFFKIRKNSQRLFFLRNLFGAYIIELVIKKRKVEYNDETIFYTYWFSYAPLGLSMLKHAGILKKNKLISRAHSYEIHEKEVGSFFPLRNFTYKYVDQVFAISDLGTNIIRNKYSEFASKIQTSRLGVLPIKKCKNLLEEKAIHVVSCSGVRPEKRVELLFKSLNQYSKTVPDITITWSHIGGGGSYESLKKLIQMREANLEILLLGFMENYEVIDYYKKNNLNIFINISTTEGVPVSIMEAISANIPILATNVGETGEIVTIETGVMIDKDFSQTEFNNGINFIISNYETISKTISKYWFLHYNANLNYNNFYKVLSDL